MDDEPPRSSNGDYQNFDREDSHATNIPTQLVSSDIDDKFHDHVKNEMNESTTDPIITLNAISEGEGGEIEIGRSFSSDENVQIIHVMYESASDEDEVYMSLQPNNNNNNSGINQVLPEESYQVINVDYDEKVNDLNISLPENDDLESDSTKIRIERFATSQDLDDMLNRHPDTKVFQEMINIEYDYDSSSEKDEYFLSIVGDDNTPRKAESSSPHHHTDHLTYQTKNGKLVAKIDSAIDDDDDDGGGKKPPDDESSYQCIYVHYNNDDADDNAAAAAVDARKLILTQSPGSFDSSDKVDDDDGNDRAQALGAAAAAAILPIAMLNKKSNDDDDGIDDDGDAKPPLPIPSSASSSSSSSSSLSAPVDETPPPPRRDSILKTQSSFRKQTSFRSERSDKSNISAVGSNTNSDRQPIVTFDVETMEKEEARMERDYYCVIFGKRLDRRLGFGICAFIFAWFLILIVLVGVYSADESEMVPSGVVLPNPFPPSSVPSHAPTTYDYEYYYYGDKNQPTPTPTYLKTVAPTESPTYGELVLVPRGRPISGSFDKTMFGYYIDLSGNGKRLSLGCPLFDGDAGIESGFTKVYDIQGDEWTPVGSQINGSEENDWVGYTSPLSPNGQWMAVSVGLGSNAKNDQYVQVYQNDVANNQWNPKGQPLTGPYGFGVNSALSKDGSRIVVSSKNYVDVFYYDDVIDSWNRIGYTISDDSFTSVDISEDGTRVAVGAPFYEPNGRVRVFDVSVENNVVKQVGNSMYGNEIYDRFGYSVSMSSDGRIVAAGAPNATFGYAKVHMQSSESDDWTQLGTDVRENSNSRGTSFGFSLSLSGSGGRMVVGAPLYNRYRGKASIYRFDRYSEQWDNVLQIEGLKSNDQEGYGVTISSDGDFVATSAVNANNQNGRVSVFQLNGR